MYVFLVVKISSLKIELPSSVTKVAFLKVSLFSLVWNASRELNVLVNIMVNESTYPYCLVHIKFSLYKSSSYCFIDLFLFLMKIRALGYNLLFCKKTITTATIDIMHTRSKMCFFCDGLSWLIVRRPYAFASVAAFRMMCCSTCTLYII